MQKIAIIPISEAGIDIASTLQRQLKAQAIQRTEVGAQWKNFDAFIFIGAMGICVRTIAPYVEDKHTDPAVVCVDSLGMNAISVLSGHIGGANDLTQEVASIIGANPIITTQSDNAGLWALDTLANQFGWTLLFKAPMQDLTLNDCIYRFVNKQPTALYLRARDEGTEYMERTLPEHVTLVSGFDELKKGNFQLYIIVSPHNELLPIGIPTIHYVPRVMTLGVGLAHQAHPADEIHQEINNHIGDMGILPESIREYCTIDVKADEPYIQRQLYYGHKVRFFTADELAKVDVPNPSKTVAKHVGTPSVCEAAAILGAHHGRLVLRKLKGKNWTAAVAIDRQYERETKGHIEIVGAGPGDPDLVSVRGRKMLEKADLILYAGSLVPKALTDCHKPGAVVRSSADMNLEEQCELMKKHYDQGHFIVRLHTGDPCIFGAIQEQMAFFDQHQMSYHITPGISSFLAAAAELRSQFTIPERTQTIILTRGEGRTPMPEKEQLHLLARSQSTMCIFLSASIVDDVQAQLLQEYPEDTPVAACYHLTWPDQHIYRGKLKDLAKIVHDNKLTLTTMLVVGEAIDNRQGLSELYNKSFTHLFRKGE
ncbi:MAG: precorrin-4 C(11)-methyltransferase [Bacteroidaceae bacterium]|nr:precorrin-4 C(11)-methyltransferase [Bacteroidaceae bacterium]